MTTQTEAEQLANALEHMHFYAPADELRRLVSFNQQLMDEVARLNKAVAAEREACAKVCDDFERAKWESVKNISQNGGRVAFVGPMHCAAAIRARGNI